MSQTGFNYLTGVMSPDRAAKADREPGGGSSSTKKSGAMMIAPLLKMHEASR
jgi:hypothetical protein